MTLPFLARKALIALIPVAAIWSGVAPAPAQQASPSPSASASPAPASPEPTASAEVVSIPSS